MEMNFPWEEGIYEVVFNKNDVETRVHQGSYNNFQMKQSHLTWLVKFSRFLFQDDFLWYFLMNDSSLLG